MGSPIIFAGQKAKLLTAQGLQLKSGASIDNDGVKNYIANGHAEVDTTGWSTYSNAAGRLPVTGAGGTSNISFTRSTSGNLGSTGNFLFSKPAAVSSQGHGAAYDFIINQSDRAKVLQISFDYRVGSGTFIPGSSSIDSSVIAYIYNVTTGTLIEPSSIKLLSNNTDLADKFTATFQTSATGTSYRLILHCATAATDLFTVQFKHVVVSPSTYSYGTPITEWAAYTPVTQGFGTMTGVNAMYRRVGSSYEILFRGIAGTTDASQARVGLPSGATVLSTVPANQHVGRANRSGGVGTPLVNVTGGNTYVNFANEAAANTSISVAGNNTVGTGETFSFFASVQIQGLGASTQMSEDASTRVITARAAISANTTIGTAATKILNLSVTSDRAGMIDTTNNRFNINVAGDYQFGASGYVAGPSGFILLGYKVNGVGSPIWATDSASADRKNGSALIPNLKSGDYVEVMAQVGSTGTLTVDSGTYFTMQRISGPNQIAASERVVVRAFATASTLGSTDIVFSTKTRDTHAAMTTTTFTALTAGDYSVAVALHFSFAVSARTDVVVYKNGVAYDQSLFANTSASTMASTVSVNTVVPMIAGDTITVRHIDTVNTITHGTTGLNYGSIAIAKI